VTVDWVVLTAAIVGIAIAVIALISGGVENASEGIDSELRVAGTGWDFSTPSTSIQEYLSDFVDNRIDSGGFNDLDELNGDIFALMEADKPEGYDYYGSVDTASGNPVYEKYSDTGETIYNIGGVDYDQFQKDGDGGDNGGYDLDTSAIYYDEAIEDWVGSQG